MLGNMRISAPLGAHFMDNYGNTGSRDLPGRLTASQSAANDVDGGSSVHAGNVRGHLSRVIWHFDAKVAVLSQWPNSLSILASSLSVLEC
jgi:hypothetical protein